MAYTYYSHTLTRELQHFWYPLRVAKFAQRIKRHMHQVLLVLGRKLCVPERSWRGRGGKKALFLVDGAMKKVNMLIVVGFR